MIHANLVGEDAEAGEVEHVVLDVPKNNHTDGPKLQDWYEQWWSSLDRDRTGIA